MDANGLMIALRRLAAIHIDIEQEKTNFLDVLTKLEGRREDRNLIAHGTWGTYRDPTEPLNEFVPIAGSLKPKAPIPTELVSETFPSGRMYEIIEDIEDAIRFFVNFLTERDPSRDKRKLEHLLP
jgi:hypothetical protein